MLASKDSSQGGILIGADAGEDEKSCSEGDDEEERHDSRHCDRCGGESEGEEERLTERKGARLSMT